MDGCLCDIVDKATTGSMTHNPSERVSGEESNLGHEFVFALFDQLFPSQSTKTVLEIGHTFSPRIVEQFAKRRIVCNTHLASLLPVSNT